MQFNELNLLPEILKAIEDMGYETPSEIQEREKQQRLESLLYQ